ncbi:hypothetical protein LTS18_013939, partial [Coniosporium uncinatum]
MYSSHVATAASNGKVILYDLNSVGVEFARLHEHARQVHRVRFNPHQGFLLLSASQDGTARLWDIRDPRREAGAVQAGPPVGPSRAKYLGQADGIRDLKWSPTDGLKFAFGTDSGVIEQWDYSNPKQPLLKINAHEKTCHSVDWHPDGKHLLSASADKTVKIWDFESGKRRQKPGWVLQCPYGIQNARWRPPCLSSNLNDAGMWQSTQIATSYDKYPDVHVWDLRRASVPFREVIRGNIPPADLLWQSTDLMWSVDSDGLFSQSDVQFTRKVVDLRSPAVNALTPQGELLMFSQRRALPRQPSLEYASDETVTAPNPRFLEHDNGFTRNSADD